MYKWQLLPWLIHPKNHCHGLITLIQDNNRTIVAMVDTQPRLNNRCHGRTDVKRVGE